MVEVTLTNEVTLEVLGYQLSEKFERFYEEQKEFLGLEEIVFVPMSEHPNPSCFLNAYGTTVLDKDRNILQIYLDHKHLGLHPAAEQDYVAEIISVHEILHEWTKAKGYPEIYCDERISDDFLNLFHHQVITRVMDQLEYDYSIPDRFVAKEFVEHNTALIEAEGLPEYKTGSVRFWVFTIKYAEYYFKFPPEYYEKARQLVSGTNMNLLLRSDQCVAVIQESKCWENPNKMFLAMKRVRDLLSLPSDSLDIKNPETGEWC